MTGTKDMSQAQETHRQIVDTYHASGAVIDGLWFSGAVAAKLLEIERIIGGFLAAALAIMAVVTAFYRLQYWYHKAKREKSGPVYDVYPFHGRSENENRNGS